ncbi:hypothetical protein FRC00_013944, partial [Tulasnella sp. 408]
MAGPSASLPSQVWPKSAKSPYIFVCPKSTQVDFYRLKSVQVRLASHFILSGP